MMNAREPSPAVVKRAAAFPPRRRAAVDVRTVQAEMEPPRRPIHSEGPSAALALWCALIAVIIMASVAGGLIKWN